MLSSVFFLLKSLCYIKKIFFFLYWPGQAIEGGFIMKKQKMFPLNVTICRITVSILFLFLFITKGFSISITFMIGDVHVFRDGKKISADINTEMKSGDILTTGKGGIAAVSYNDGSEIRIRENSKIIIGNKHIKDSEDVSVISGIVKGKFSKLLKGNERKVYTPTTVCSVRGTDFLVGVSDGADSKVELTEGSLDVYNPYGRVDLEENQNVEIGLAEKPEKKGGQGSGLDDWKKTKNNDLDQDPGKKSKKFQNYMDKFSSRSSKSSKNINRLENNQGTTALMSKRSLEKTNEKIENIEKEIADDFFLGSAVNGSIDGIVNRYKKDKEDMYNIFLKIKKESNRVLEQQRINAEAIRAVKEAYKKAYEEIMRKHTESINKIKESYRKNKPPSRVK